MKKQAFLRGLLGFPIGMAIGYVITIFISLRFGQGNYLPCVPQLIDTMGSECSAVILQAILSGLLGSAFAACSVIWEIGHWSIAKQTGIYFFVTAFVMLPIAYVANWMEHSCIGFFTYLGIFVVIFVVMWMVQCLIWRAHLKKINASFEK